VKSSIKVATAARWRLVLGCSLLVRGSESELLACHRVWKKKIWICRLVLVWVIWIGCSC
jgi:hypothetical protein